MITFIKKIFTHKGIYPLVLIGGASLFFLFSLSVLFLIKPVNEKVYPQIFIVSDGQTIRSVAEDLKEEGFIVSPTIFIISNYLFGGDFSGKVIKGVYNISQKKNTYSIARDLYFGNKNTPFKKLVIKERTNYNQIADDLKKLYPNFEKNKFINLAKEKHGMLYPETYFFEPDHTLSPEAAIKSFTDTFELKTKELFDGYVGDFSKKDIIILASIVDLEAHREEERKKVASVLINRLEIDMPLQVDVSFLYINGKNTFQLSREDLAKENKHNTYVNKGLPPIAITNPTVESINAVINAPETKYLFFLADPQGRTYFSETYNQHLTKKAKYVDPIK